MTSSSYVQSGGIIARALDAMPQPAAFLALTFHPRPAGRRGRRVIYHTERFMSKTNGKTNGHVVPATHGAFYVRMSSDQQESSPEIQRKDLPSCSPSTTPRW